jgi:zinc-binding in reverse transcriptase
MDFVFIWKTKIPLKMQFFLWLVKKNVVLTKLNLKKKKEAGMVLLSVSFVQKRNLLIIFLLHALILTLFGNGLLDIIFTIFKGLLCKICEI